MKKSLLSPPKPVSLLRGRAIHVRYKNWQGEKSVRRLWLMSSPYWGSNEFHPVPTWMILAEDLDDKAKGVRAYTIDTMEPV